MVICYIFWLSSPILTPSILHLVPLPPCLFHSALIYQFSIHIRQCYVVPTSSTHTCTSTSLRYPCSTTKAYVAKNGAFSVVLVLSSPCTSRFWVLCSIVQRHYVILKDLQHCYTIRAFLFPELPDDIIRLTCISNPCTKICHQLTLLLLSFYTSVLLLLSIQTYAVDRLLYSSILEANTLDPLQKVLRYPLS